MKKFTDTRLWNMLGNPKSGQTGKDDFTAVIDEFVDELHLYCRNETNIAERTRSLNYARNKLLASLECYKQWSGKKCAVI